MGKDRRGEGTIKALWRLVDEFMRGRKVLIPLLLLAEGLLIFLKFLAFALSHRADLE